MSALDWSILLGSLMAIALYGMWRSRHVNSSEGYLRGDRPIPWYAVGLSVMATQASAITFLSAPGQAYTDGMRFVQFYFGLPLAMIIICAFFVPVYHRLKVYTAYEYLEGRFDQKTRSMAAGLFLIQRGIASGLTIYAPAIILSTLLGWNIYWTNVFIGGVVIAYTVGGGTRAVSYTQLGQMSIIILGMVLAGIYIFRSLPQGLGLDGALQMAGEMGRMNIIDTEFSLKNSYNLWSGLLGGLFLALSYFGTDQSQVARYLSSRSLTQSRLGLLFNGLLKIPMQFGILLIGVLLYVFFLFVPPPIHFNRVELNTVRQSPVSEDFLRVEESYVRASEQVQEWAAASARELKTGNKTGFAAGMQEVRKARTDMDSLRKQGTVLMEQNNPLAATRDVNYIFLSYVLQYLPHGLIGLLIAVIFAASMSSTASELNALAGTTVVDVIKRNARKEIPDRQLLRISRWATVAWGMYAIGVAMLATNLGSLIEAVNQLGSYFYGTILGIFIVGFFLPQIRGGRVFYAAIFAQATVLLCAWLTPINFLWYNVIGALAVMFFGKVLQAYGPRR